MNDMATVYVDWTHSATHRTDVNQTAEFYFPLTRSMEQFTTSRVRQQSVTELIS